MKYSLQLSILLITAILIMLIPFFWFAKIDGFLYVHDGTGIPIFKEEAYGFIYTWNRMNLGANNLFGITNVITWSPYYLPIRAGISIRHVQLLVFSSLLVLPFLSFYFSIKTILRNASFGALYLGSLLYSLNLYLNIMWHTGVYFSGLYIPYILAPVVIAILFKLLYQDKIVLWKYLIYSILIALSLIHHAYSLALIIIPGLILFLCGFISIRRSYILKNYLILGIITASLSLWWALPLGHRYISVFHDPLLALYENDITGGSLVNSTMLHQLMLFSSWAFGRQWGGREFMSFAPPYINNLALRGMWLFTLLVAIIPSTIVLFLKNTVYNKYRLYIGFSLILLFISTFLAKGAGPPFGNISTYLTQDVPILNLLRNPDSKLGATIVLSLAMLLVISVDFLQKAKSRVFIFTLYISLIASILVYSFPLITGEAVIEKRRGDHFTRDITIPENYKFIKNSLSSNNQQLNFIQFPPHSANYWVTDIEKDQGYWGPDIIAKSIQLPLIQNIKKATAYRHTSDLIEQFVEHPSVNLFKTLRIGYISFRDDIEKGTLLYTSDYYKDKFDESYLSKVKQINSYSNPDIEIHFINSEEYPSLLEYSQNSAYYSGTLSEFALIMGKPDSLLENNTMIIDLLKNFNITNMPIISSGEKYFTDDLENMCYYETSCFTSYIPLSDEYDTQINIPVEYISSININNISYTDKIIGSSDQKSIIQDIPLKQGNNEIYINYNLESINLVKNEILEKHSPVEAIITPTIPNTEYEIKYNYNTEYPIELIIQEEIYDYSSFNLDKPDESIKSRFVDLHIIKPEITEGQNITTTQKFRTSRDSKSIKLIFRINPSIADIYKANINQVDIVILPNTRIYFSNDYNNKQNSKQDLNYYSDNNTKYILDTLPLLKTLNDSPNQSITFYQSYDRYWYFMLMNKNSPKIFDYLPVEVSQYLSKLFLGKPYYEAPKVNHFLSNGYANGWLFDDEFKTQLESWDILVIEYTPQRLVYSGFLISILSITVLSTIILIGIIKNKKK